MRVLILGAAGRDFHDFNTCFRGGEDRVVAFTATQIPDIAGRTYPAALAGPEYPDGIPILPEADLETLIAAHDVDEVVLSYSDLSHEEVMHLASRALAAGADFRLLGPKRMQLRATKPVVSVCAARTGCGKSHTARRVATLLQARGLRVVALRHPMPYGDLEAQAVQRFASHEDFDRAACTIEEREEYEPWIELGLPIYAGVDYARILERAEAEADVLLWDGGNNDLPLLRPDLALVVVDALRPGHEARYHPGEANVRAADAIVLNKIDAADGADVRAVRARLRALNPSATVVDAAFPLSVDDPAALAGKRVVVVEDGPTLTHGGMPTGAGWAAAQRWGAEVVDPRPHAVGSLRATVDRFPHLGPVLPAMGYGPAQVADLERTLNAVPADLVLVGTPVDLGRLLTLERPAVRVRYALQELGRPTLADVLDGAACLQPPKEAS